jgi:phage gpG-like protein
VRIEADFFGEDLVASKIAGVGERATDLRPAFREMAQILRENATRQFESAGGHGSGGWAPLAPSTRRRKEGAGLSEGILQMTQRLRESLTTDSSPDAIVDYDRESFKFGTRVSYTKYHQSGTSRMPRRRVLETTKAERKQITRAVYEQVMKDVGRAAR